MEIIKKLCVFCGSSKGNDPVYARYARSMANVIYEKNIVLIYGGGSVGLMGIMADEMIRLGGEVIGVIPGFLADKEVDHKGVTQMITVSSMHDRKQKMSEISDAFIAMPGGFGTLEELAEILTWAQLGLVKKPIGLLNINGYYDPLISQFDLMTKTKFLKPQNRDLLYVGHEPAELLELMNNYKPLDTEKWLDESQT